jgi:hypothetical protein
VAIRDELLEEVVDGGESVGGGGGGDTATCARGTAATRITASVNPAPKTGFMGVVCANMRRT